MTGLLIRWLEVSPKTKTPRPCGDDVVLSGRTPSQMGWYGFLGDVVEGQSVLDVGCGSGEGLRILTNRATSALGIDLDHAVGHVRA